MRLLLNKELSDCSIFNTKCSNRVANYRLLRPTLKNALEQASLEYVVNTFNSLLCSAANADPDTCINSNTGADVKSSKCYRGMCTMLNSKGIRVVRLVWAVASLLHDLIDGLYLNDRGGHWGIPSFVLCLSCEHILL